MKLLREGDDYLEYENVWNVNEVKHASNYHDYPNIILDGRISD